MNLSYEDFQEQIVTRHRAIYDALERNNINPLNYMWTLDKFGNTVLSWLGDPDLQETAYRRIRTCTGIFVLREVRGNLSGMVVAVV